MTYLCKKKENLDNIFEYHETKQKNQPITFSPILEAIAKGVEARLIRLVIANIVTLETMRIARKLHIPEEEIQEWRSSRFYRPESDRKIPFLKDVDGGK